jgi:hypothetical protein
MPTPPTTDRQYAAACAAIEAALAPLLAERAALEAANLRDAAARDAAAPAVAESQAAYDEAQRLVAAAERARTKAQERTWYRQGSNAPDVFVTTMAGQVVAPPDERTVQEAEAAREQADADLQRALVAHTTPDAAISRRNMRLVYVRNLIAQYEDRRAALKAEQQARVPTRDWLAQLRDRIAAAVAG